MKDEGVVGNQDDPSLLAVVCHEGLSESDSYQMNFVIIKR